MRHGKKFNHLSRKRGHRKALLKNMAVALIEHKRIKTTVAKAKALRQFIEPLMTRSKKAASAELIKQETRPCPSCGIRIYKIEGCDQMWCTGCHVAFSWRTGLRVNGPIHNPHFYQFQRQGGGAVIQNPGAQICGGLPTYYQMRDRVQYIERDGVSFKKTIQSLFPKI